MFIDFIEISIRQTRFPLPDSLGRDPVSNDESRV